MIYDTDEEDVFMPCKEVGLSNLDFALNKDDNMPGMKWMGLEKSSLIREFVYGLFAGIAMSGKTRLEVLEEEFWMNWDSDTELHIYEDDITDEWCCTAYQCNDYSQFNGNEFKRIAIEDKWK